MTARGKIITIHEYPPIPIRQFDWRAYHDGEEETNHCGWGATEAEALADLKERDWERDEAAVEEEIAEEERQANGQFRVGT